jgi:hypothetical protein
MAQKMKSRNGARKYVSEMGQKMGQKMKSRNGAEKYVSEITHGK